MISAVIDRQLAYPDAEDAFSPADPGPEYPFADRAPRPNRVYQAVRRVWEQAGLDAARRGTAAWNPLGRWVQPGQQVFVLCNFVYQRRPRESLTDFHGKCTHASVLRALIDYLLIAVGDEGRVLFGNAPLQSCQLDSVLHDTGAQAILDFYARQGAPVEHRDLRLFVAERGKFSEPSRIQRRDEDQGVHLDLGQRSLLAVHGPQARYRVTDYDPRRTESFHSDGRHIYVVHRDVLASDLIFSVPKLKTHEKVGITCALKGCVGAIGHKDCLAHHRFGPPADNGDEYPQDRLGLLRVGSQVHELVQQTSPDQGWGKALRVVDRITRRVLRSVEPGGSGAWWGNDTCWRMSLDIARLLAHGTPLGTIDRDPPRPHLVLLDGIVGGEGQGPLDPRAVASGALLFGDHPAWADYYSAILMGYDPAAIPLVREAFTLTHLTLGAPATAEPVIVNGKPATPEELRQQQSRSKFAAPAGWAGKL